jgi:U3 small nucleolar RNA-associated protein 18
LEANGGRAEFDGLNGILDLEETTFGAEGVDASIVFGTGEIHSVISSSRGGLSLINTERTPHKSIMNLTTSADNLCFNSTGDILAMSTKREKNGLKLLHVPSATVFSNWPTSKTPLKYVWSMDFSPGSKYLAVGNDHGKVLLYRLKHYWD